VNTLGALAETIIPSDEHSPGAKAAGVPAYIDTIVSAGDNHLKQLYSQGLEAIDALAQASGRKPFTACTPTEQVAILQKLSVNEDHPLTLEDKFFVALKRATVDGYYTSSIGIHQDLEYQGNKMVHNFTGCTHSNHEGEEEHSR
jgi:gluconate 2-dehydrogenase gamma chain